MNKTMKHWISAGLVLVMSSGVYAQTPAITLDSCYVWARQNYPLVKQQALIAKSSAYTLQNAAKGYLPQININGQATYQSDVTTIPVHIPGMDIPELSKDQYKLYAEINQPIYDGGMIRERKKLETASAAVEEQSLEVQLYQLKDRVNQLFFGILLIDEQLIQHDLMKKDIQLGLDKAVAAIAGGIALRSSADVLKAELLQADQQTLALKADRKAFTDRLMMFINRPLEESTVFVKPPAPVSSTEIIRPELRAFGLQRAALDVQDDLIAAKNRPRLSFFAQGGVGKPAFNIFSNSVDPFYIGGLRLSIPLSGYYTMKNDKSLIHIQKETIAIQQETFLFNTHFALKGQHAEITRLQNMLQSDDEIIPLRTNIKKTALAQLENGVINTRDYLREVNAEDGARQSRILHEVQLLMAQYSERTTTGNE